MSNLRVLLKYNFINSTGINKFIKGSKKEKVKIGSLGTLITFSFIAILVMITSYYMMLGEGLLIMGMMDMLLGTALMLSIGMSFFTSIYKAQGILFSSRDFDMLISMPIKSSTLLTAKIIQLLGLNYLFTIGIVGPAFGVYYYYMEPSISFFIYAILGIFFVPLIPIVIASILAFFLTNVSTRFKGKNLMLILGCIIFLVLFFIGSAKINEIFVYLINNSASILEAINKFYPPLAMYISALSEGKLMNFIFFVGISLIVFIIFVMIFNKSYSDINARNKENYKKGNYELKSLKSSSMLSSLVKKEIKRYFSSPMYVLNTAIGEIMITIVSIGTFIFGAEKVLELLEMPGTGEMIPLFMLAMLSGMMMITSTTTSSISLEGKNIWILKTMPISVMDIFKAKIAVNLTITIPTILINAILFFIGLKLSPIELIWMTVLPTLCAFLASTLGLIVNLYYPNLTWVNEVTVIKQSAAVLIDMFVSMVLIAIPIALFIYLNITNVTMYLTLVTVFALIINIVLWIILKTKGQKLFLKL